MLRKAFIQNPTTSPTFWCDSWIFATSTGSTALPFRLSEHRYPSAHTGVTSNSILQTFLNPYNGSSWANDTSTVNSSSGQIESFSYNSTGLQTDALVKYGESGTAYYVSANDYGDSVNPTVVTGTYDYPTQTTTTIKRQPDDLQLHLLRHGSSAARDQDHDVAHGVDRPERLRCRHDHRRVLR